MPLEIALISFLLLHLLIGIQMKRTLNSQCTVPILDFRSVVSGFLPLRHQLVAINLEGIANVICNESLKSSSLTKKRDNPPSNVFWSSSTCEINRAFSSCSSWLMSGSRLELDPSLLYMLGSESFDLARLMLSLESSIMSKWTPKSAVLFRIAFRSIWLIHFNYPAGRHQPKECCRL